MLGRASCGRTAQITVAREREDILIRKISVDEHILQDSESNSELFMYWTLNTAPSEHL